MTMDKSTIKVFFGLIIFMFSLALAYFTATYVQSEAIFDYWATLALFAGVYALIGVVVYQVFPVSLGFLFSADVLILHLLFENFGDMANIMKTVIIGVILAMLYLFAWVYMKDEAPNVSQPTSPPSTPVTPSV